MQSPNNKNLSAVIAAAGKGTRSKLSYPKCLFTIKNKTILGRILEAIPEDVKSTNIIVSNDGYPLIESYLKSIKKEEVNLVIQEKQLGMGNAILQLDNIRDILEENILLLWGDLPFISSDSIENLMLHHFNDNNDFSFLTLKSNNTYTIVERDNFNNVKKVVETKECLEAQIPINACERDIGVFIFKRDLVFEYLKKDFFNKFGQQSGEHGFLYVIEHLVNHGYRVSGLETTKAIEGVSFNSIDDIEEFL